MLGDGEFVTVRLVMARLGMLTAPCGVIVKAGFDV